MESPVFDYDFHGGLDLQAADSTPVYAIYKGKVVYRTKTTQRGNWIAIYDKFLWHEYFHLKAFNVSEGDTVDEGDLIAWSGNTGQTTGPHLHLGYRIGDKIDYWSHYTMNPLNVLPYENAYGTHGKCPDITTYHAWEHGNSGYIDSIWFWVDTPQDELDLNKILVYLCTDTCRIIEMNFDKHLNVNGANNTGDFIHFEGDAIFETRVTIDPWDFTAENPQTITVYVNPTNNGVFEYFTEDSITSMGVYCQDLRIAVDPLIDCLFTKNAWGNVSGTPVIGPLSSFIAESNQNEIKVRWKMSSDRALKGVNLYRSETRDQGFKKINKELLELDKNPRKDNHYTFTDRDVIPRVEYFYKLEKVFKNEKVEFFSEIVSAIIIPDFALDQNYPNPFNAWTLISYDIDSEKPVRTSLCIYNILGQKVRILVNEEKSAGHYQIKWDGRDDKGYNVASGIYFYVLKTDKNIDKKKMLLLK